MNIKMHFLIVCLNSLDIFIVASVIKCLLIHLHYMVPYFDIYEFSNSDIFFSNCTIALAVCEMSCMLLN